MLVRRSKSRLSDSIADPLRTDSRAAETEPEKPGAWFEVVLNLGWDLAKTYPKNPTSALTLPLEYWLIYVANQVVTSFPAQLLPETNGKQAPGSVPPWAESHGPMENGS